MGRTRGRILGIGIFQFVKVAHDPVANIDLIKRFRERAAESGLMLPSLGYLPEGVNHSSLSRRDVPTESKWGIIPFIRIEADVTGPEREMNPVSLHM